ncbi:MAG: hypothetical protein QXT63_06375, partial [Thermoplasmata archaeon]
MKKMLNFGIVFAGMLIISLFSISANADVEPNDNLNSAENVNFGTISGSISSTDTEDNYKFSGITKDDVVFVNLTSAPVGTEISLYDGESGSYIGSKVGFGSKFVYCPNEETTQS